VRERGGGWGKDARPPGRSLGAAFGTLPSGGPGGGAVYRTGSVCLGAFIASTTGVEKRLTLTEIGKRLGLGKSTVQRAMANDPRCNPETAERVRRAAAELGYRPDPIFAALASRRDRRGGDGIPLVLLVDGHPDLVNAGGPVADAIAARAAALGYRVETVNLRTCEAPRRLWKILFARGVAGVLAQALRAEHAELLAGNDLFPVVCVGRTDPLPYNTVRPSIQFSVHQVWERMKQLGYRRIGAAILRHEPMVEDDFSRFAAALACAALSEHADGPPVPPLRTPITAPSDIARWAREHRPDAVIGFHVGQYFLLRDEGFRIPEEIGFACLHLDGADPGTNHLGLMAGIVQDYPLIARSAVNLLDQMIRHGERGQPEKPITIMVHSTWKDGASLPPRGTGETAGAEAAPLQVLPS
jgi:LacI family transcriptional regulator